MTVIHRCHGLPDDSSGLDSHWFEGLTDFQKTETRRQAEFKRKKWPSMKDGVYSKRPGYHYPHILPAEHREKNFYLPIYGDVLEYLKSARIAIHTEAHNLRSSQVCCFNFLFPLKKDLDKATQIFSSALLRLKQVLCIEFEYTGPDDSATTWLGEPPGGKPGQNRTSIDAAVWWEDQDGHKRLTFIEWKYTESEFGACGGYLAKGNKERDKCLQLKVQSVQPEQECYLATGKNSRTSRHYWEHLAEAGISLKRWGNRPGCPFRGPFYQLMRQYLLAAYCRAIMSEVHDVDLVVITFQGNHDLLHVPLDLNHLGEDVVSAWNRLLAAAPPLRLVFVEDMLANAPNDEWRAYIRERYNV